MRIFSVKIAVAIVLWATTGISGLSMSPAQAPTKNTWCDAEIDYSAANEYVHAHYGDLAPRIPYFCSAAKKESVYDARHGVLSDNGVSRNTASMDSCGFTLEQGPTKVSDWTDLSQIRDVYLPELHAIVHHAYGDHNTILHLIFWNPMLRGESFEQTRSGTTITPTAGYAASPHIDMDVGAYLSPEDLLNLFEKNKLDTGAFPRQALADCIRKGHRFAIVNAWRNVGDTRVVRSPLALFSVRYDDPKAFPEAAPNMAHSRWYVFSNMSNEEVLLFCQYDRDGSRPSDLWHCALTDIGDLEAAERRSFDIRCFIVFGDIVPTDRDRFGEHRLSSLLTRDQSRCFCDEQAARRESN